MAYQHGVFIQEQATSLVTPVEVNSALPVIVGTAPVHHLGVGVARPVNVPKLIYSMSDFVTVFGAPAEGESAADYTLYEAANLYLARYKVAPIVAINVFDPAVHVAGPDAPVPGAPDVTKVVATDIIGGIDSTTKARKGLALVEEVYPRFRLIPGQILAPGFSGTPSVALAVGEACSNICGHFRAMGIIDVPDEVKLYTEVPAWLNDNNLTDINLLCMFGSPVYGGLTEHGSSHLAGVIGQRDAENDGIPFWSPSNKRLQCEGLVHAGRDLNLTPIEGAYLNGNGIVTGLNMVGGIVAWGDQTAGYPGITDVKDTSIPIRRMFNWVGNTLVLTCWQYVSNPLRRRMIETVQDTFNVWLNGLVGREYLLGGRVAFETVDNPTTDLMAGKVRWHMYLTPPQAARELTFVLEYDPSYLSTLYGLTA